MEGIERLQSYPDVTFIEAISFEELKDQMIRNFEEKYKELTGSEVTLAAADPYRLILYACAVAIYQGYQYEDRAGKMGLLKYSTGEYLDNLAALKGVTRNSAVAARTRMRFTLSTVLSRTATIPKGVRIKGQELYFETEESGEIPPGELSVDIPARCQIAGKTGNGYRAGDIKTLVDPLPYTLEVHNIDTTSGGSDRETDDELAERIYLSPSSYSTAGPEQAYEYWVKSYSQAIDECKVVTESPGEVDIYVTVDGELPEDDFIERLGNYLKDDQKRPLTDHVVVKKPEIVSYDIEAVYFIRSADRDMEETIQNGVQRAQEHFVEWQRRIGRDVTPAQLVCEIMQAGAQSVEIKKPVYMELKDTQLAVPGKIEITYGGLRNG